MSIVNLGDRIPPMATEEKTPSASYDPTYSVVWSSESESSSREWAALCAMSQYQELWQELTSTEQREPSSDVTSIVAAISHAQPDAAAFAPKHPPEPQDSPVGSPRTFGGLPSSEAEAIAAVITTAQDTGQFDASFTKRYQEAIHALVDTLQRQDTQNITEDEATIAHLATYLHRQGTKGVALWPRVLRGMTQVRWTSRRNVYSFSFDAQRGIVCTREDQLKCEKQLWGRIITTSIWDPHSAHFIPERIEAETGSKAEALLQCITHPDRVLRLYHHLGPTQSAVNARHDLALEVQQHIKQLQDASEVKNDLQAPAASSQANGNPFDDLDPTLLMQCDREIKKPATFNSSDHSSDEADSRKGNPRMHNQDNPDDDMLFAPLTTPSPSASRPWLAMACGTLLIGTALATAAMLSLNPAVGLGAMLLSQLGLAWCVVLTALVGAAGLSTLGYGYAQHASAHQHRMPESPKPLSPSVNSSHRPQVDAH